MRFFTLLLLLLNLVFFAWSQGYMRPAHQDSQRMAQQIEPAALRVVSRDEAPKALNIAPEPTLMPTPEANTALNSIENPPAKAPETPAPRAPNSTSSNKKEAAPPSAIASKPAVAEPLTVRAGDSACLYYAGLPANRVSQLEATLLRQFPAAQTVHVATEVNANYWVYIPPLANRQLVDKKVAELVKFGVRDYFVVHESGVNNLAISLGLFSSKEGAETLLKSLRGKGIRSAKISERRDRQASIGWQIYINAADAPSLTEALSHELSGIKPMSCKRAESGL